MNTEVLTAVGRQAEAMFSDVAACRIALHDGMAVLVADVLGVAMEPGLDVETADTLLQMCSQWALQRRRALQADLALRHDPVPDDVAELLEPGGEQQ